MAITIDEAIEVLSDLREKSILGGGTWGRSRQSDYFDYRLSIS